MTKSTVATKTGENTVPTSTRPSMSARTVATPSAKSTTERTARTSTPAEITKATAASNKVQREQTVVSSTVQPKSAPSSNIAASQNTKEVAATKTEKKTKKSEIKAEKASKTKSSSGGAAVAADDNKKRILFAVIAAVVTIALVFGVAFGVRACRNKNKGANVPSGALSDVIIAVPEKGEYLLGSGVVPSSSYDNVSVGVEHFSPSPDTSDTQYNTSAKTNTVVGYFGEVLGTVDRNIPNRTRDEGLTVYPKYGHALSTVIGGDDDKVAARDALIYESSYLSAAGTWNGGAGGYTWMDKDGFLYTGTVEEPVPVLDKSGHHRRLYKHTTAIGLYGGDVSDDEPGIIKKVTMRPRGYNGYGVTGVYAPAGEVIKITISERDMNVTGGLTIHIGQALYNGKANNIWTAKNQMQRIPILLNTMTVDKTTSVYDETAHTYTAYVGSFLGGPLYIRNTNAQFTATISGGVAYSHYILGYTTKSEFDKNKASSAPYFDLEVWDYGVLHSGPKRQASAFSYDDIYKSAVLWDKISSVTTTNSKQGIVFLYDPFVAAGAAVAFPGQRSVNCPEGWMANSLNYNGIVTNGAWGNLHEYHHNFQGYGVGGGGEVTNNGMTLVSYALFTEISASRTLSNNGAGPMSGWNAYTSATWALNDTLKISRGQEPGNGKQGLALYATLLHNFGPDNYIKAKVKQQQTGDYKENYEGYLRAWQDVTHNDLTYFFKDILQGIDANQAGAIANSEYSKFVPVSSVYQTGRSYMYDGQKKYIYTMQPYVIPFGQPFDIDLSKYSAPNGQYESGSIVIPDGFTYTIKGYTDPTNGTVTRIGDYKLKYTPDANSKQKTSGKIKVTLGITKNDGAFKVDDVDIVLEFKPSHETNKMTLERTTYTFAADKMYKDAQAAYKNGYAGYTDVDLNADHSNPTQNSNTDIWFYADTQAEHEKHPNALGSYFARDNTIAELNGKLYIEEEGKYRLYLRGRLNCALYYSLDGESYTLGATIKDESAPNNSHLFRTNDENTYVDLELKKNSWLYIKEVLIVQSSPAVSFIGVGLGQWTKPMFTMVDKYYDANGKEVASETAEGYHHTVTHYYDYQGIEVTEEQANSSDIMPPAVTNNTQPYVNAYRNSYEMPSGGGFESDYFYRREYAYNYTDNMQLGVGKQRVVKEQCDNLNLHNGWGGNDLSVVVDGIKDQGGKMQLHTNRSPNADSPFTLVIDLGDVYTANRLVIYSQAGRSDPQFPKALKLYSSITGHTDDYTLVKEYTDIPFSGGMQTLDFDEREMRYYKVEISQSTNTYIIIRELEMWHANEVNGGQMIAPDDDMFTYSGNWSGMQTFSSFGHVYVGGNGDTMSFEFTGTRVGFLSSAALGKNFEVYIDGNKVDTIKLKADDSGYLLTYLSGALSEGKHTVIFKCTGQASIDSIVIYP